MKDKLRIEVSKYMSYLLRHNPENLEMDAQGFVRFDEFLEKMRGRFRVSKEYILRIVEESERKRFEIVEDRIRASYGHTIPVNLGLEEERVMGVLYHGTTPEAASKILKSGLKPMERRWAHLSPTIEMARRVGCRRTDKPVILQIDVEGARKNGTRFYKATEDVYLSRYIKPEHLKRVIRT